MEDSAIKDVLAAYVEAWRRDDMEAWGRLFTEDCDFVSHAGQWWTSRQANVAEHEAVPESVSEQKGRYALDAVKTSFLAPDIALVHAFWEWPAFVQSPGDAPADRRGVLTMVMVERGGRWLIRASHNTRIAA